MLALLSIFGKWINIEWFLIVSLFLLGITVSGSSYKLSTFRKLNLRL